MKQEDMASLLLIVGISLIVSFIGARAILGSPDDRSKEVQIIRPIEAGIDTPSEKIFNDDAINPTELIDIGDTQTDTPFVESEVESEEEN